MSFLQLIETEYQNSLNRKSDINEHLPVLYDIGMECDHITEMGSRFGDSTRAFLKTNATLRAYDLELHQPLMNLFDAAKEAGKDVDYIKADVLKIKIRKTDLLFIDTWHSNAQLRQELKMHGNMAQKYLAFHDTWTYGLQDESWSKEKPSHPGSGLIPAIIDFVIANPHWKFKEFRTNCNGLTILERA